MNMEEKEMKRGRIVYNPQKLETVIFNGEFEDIRAQRMDFWKAGPAEPEKVQKIDDFLRSYTKNSIADGDRPGLFGNLTGTVSGVVSVKYVGKIVTALEFKIPVEKEINQFL